MKISSIGSTIKNSFKKAAIATAIAVPTATMTSCNPAFYGPHIRNEFYHPAPPPPTFRPVPIPQNRGPVMKPTPQRVVPQNRMGMPNGSRGGRRISYVGDVFEFSTKNLKTVAKKIKV